MGILSRFLAHPLTQGQNVDSPMTTERRREILHQKLFLKAIYKEWYRRLLSKFATDAAILEIGSGAGFIKEISPAIITSEVLTVSGVDLITDCRALPFGRSCLDGIVMVDVFHHIPSVAGFLREAARCIRPNGRLEMIEPWNTPWAKFIFQRIHPEPFEPDATWELPAAGPLSGANGALPWIVFERDCEQFSRAFPEWKLEIRELMMPFSYLFSGGISTRVGLPAFLYHPVRKLESLLNQERWAMFIHIGLVRT